MLTRQAPHASQPAQWRIDDLDLPAYLRRVGHRGRLSPDPDTLASLHRAHVATIPFENLDVLLGREVPVGLAQVQRKLVGRGRGGHCCEHNVLFGAVLQRIGFRVDRLLARTGDPAERAHPRSHLVLRVAAGGPAWLADVGFGAGLLGPLPLAAGAPQRQGAWDYRLVAGPDGGWRLRERLAGQDWATLYTFVEEPQYPVDVETANHHTVTGPRSPFARRLVVMRKGPTWARRLIGRELTVEHPGDPVRRRRLDDAGLAAALTAEFGLRLTPAELDALLAAMADSPDRD